jgi:hypothetical protein
MVHLVEQPGHETDNGEGDDGEWQCEDHKVSCHYYIAPPVPKKKPGISRSPAFLC